MFHILADMFDGFFFLKHLLFLEFYIHGCQYNWLARSLRFLLVIFSMIYYFTVPNIAAGDFGGGNQLNVEVEINDA
jgi:hypothetical protein